MPVIVTLLVLATVGCASTAPSSPSVSTAASGATVCKTTRPNGATPPGEQPSPDYDYGNGRLYTSLWPNGEILADPTYIETDGSIRMKFPWWRAPGVGVAGDLKIEGHEITTGAAVKAVIPEGYGQRVQPTGLYFPSEGCFEVTGRSGDASLTFVVKVTKVPSASN